MVECCAVTQPKKTSVCEIWKRKRKKERKKCVQINDTKICHEKLSGMWNAIHPRTQRRSLNNFPRRLWTGCQQQSALLSLSEIIPSRRQLHCQNHSTVFICYMCEADNNIHHTASKLKYITNSHQSWNSVRTLTSAIVSKSRVIVFSITFPFSFHPWQPSRCGHAYKTYCGIQGHCSTNRNLYSRLSETVFIPVLSGSPGTQLLCDMNAIYMLLDKDMQPSFWKQASLFVCDYSVWGLKHVNNIVIWRFEPIHKLYCACKCCFLHSFLAR